MYSSENQNKVDKPCFQNAHVAKSLRPSGNGLSKDKTWGYITYAMGLSNAYYKYECDKIQGLRLRNEKYSEIDVAPRMLSSAVS